MVRQKKDSPATAHGILLKKKFGQHFLRNASVVMHMLEAVTIDKKTHVLEIGPGDGFLSRAILETDARLLWAFEIDEDWVGHLEKTITDKRFTVFNTNFLDLNFSLLEQNKPWTVLANLPYQVTFPILHRLQENRAMLTEGVVMVQEEVAQKIVKKQGRGYGFVSLFFQWYFEWKLLDKVPPAAFEPPPKVYSRLLYFKPKDGLPTIAYEADFWEFIRACFAQPRRTLRNNLKHKSYDWGALSDELLDKRAQQLEMNDFLLVWSSLEKK